MRRRWFVTLEILAMLGILAWVGVALLQSTPQEPQKAIDLKVQLVGASDRVWLQETDDGQLVYRLVRDDGQAQLMSPESFARRVYDAQSSRGFWEVLLNVSSPAGFLWVAIGLFGQLLFTGRLLVQWLTSEKHRRSVVPTAFWWMSLVGATMLLVYFIWRKEPIGILGQATGWFIYVRNLWLIYFHGNHPDKSK